MRIVFYLLFTAFMIFLAYIGLDRESPRVVNQASFVALATSTNPAEQRAELAGLRDTLEVLSGMELIGELEGRCATRHLAMFDSLEKAGAKLERRQQFINKALQACSLE